MNSKTGTVIALLFLMLTAPAYAVETTQDAAPEMTQITFGGEVLRSKYEHPKGSLWQQEFAGYPTEWDTQPYGFRFWVERGIIRFSYFDLGEYHIVAEAEGDEAFVTQCSCVKSVGANTRMYYTTGSMRGFALTLRPVWHGFFLEAGPAYFRQSFKETKDDGWYFQERLWGLGYLIGAGYEFKNLSVGVYSYQASLAGKFGNGEAPTGTGGAYVFAVGFRF